MSFSTSGILCVSLLLLQSVACDQPRLIRKLEKEGFHRELVSEITLNNDVHNYPEDCRLILKEIIPSSMFVDIYQVQQMEQFGGPKVLADTKIDVEKPEYDSSLHMLYVFSQVNLAMPIRLVLPIHLRYFRPMAEHVKFATATIGNPEILIRCEGFAPPYSLDVKQAPCNSSNTSLCDWQVINYQSDVDGISAKVPIGNLDETQLVLSTTILVTAVCCVLLIYTIFKLKLTHKEKTQ